MTERLYYTDPYCREFDATIEAVEPRDGRTIVTLNRTTFYPTAGGQPFDTGTLGRYRVVDVFDDEGGTVAHVIDIYLPGPNDPAYLPLDPANPSALAGPASPEVGPNGLVLQVGQIVHGVIDWPRRFDHMQQHTGQHVLSAACARLSGVRTISFHLGAAASTIDLARELTPRELAAVEDEANRVVWEDRPVSIRFASAEEAARMPLRKEPLRGGTLRLIDVENFDLSACGGTHVARTGAIGIIAIASAERFKGGQRIEFLCGGRALSRFRSWRDILASAVRLQSVTPEGLPESIERLQADGKEQRRALGVMQGELARCRADELAASGDPTAKGRLVLRAIDADANGLKVLASAITEKPGHVAVLVSTSTPALIVVARSADVAVQSNQVLSSLTAAFGGRGGGKPDIAQGGGLNGSPQAILDAARSIIVA